MNYRLKSMDLHKRQIFKDKAYEDSFLENGFVVLPAADDVNSDALLKVHYDLEPESRNHKDSYLYSTFYCASRPVRQKVNEKLCAYFKPILEKYLVNYELFLGSFMVVKFHAQGHFHQDWSSVDERLYSSINFWMPLQDVDESSGCLRVLPGSHNVTNYYRAETTGHCPFEEYKDIINQSMVALPIKKGQLIAFNHRTIHGTSSCSGGLRVAVSLHLKPREAKLFHVYRPNMESTKANIHEVKPSFFIEHELYDEPKNAPIVSSVELAVPRLIMKKAKSYLA